MSVTKQIKTVHTGSHWGLYSVEVEDNKVARIKPFEKDPYPSRIIEAMPSAVHSQCRIMHPMVRKGWLKQGAKSTRIGHDVDSFVPISWDDILDLLAEELNRVKEKYGNEAFYASSGWASAGCFHNAQAQLARFFNCFGGFVSQVTNYSFGAASVILPHIVGTTQPVTGPRTAWPTIAKYTKLMVLFGGMSPKNSQINKDGVGAHNTVDWTKKAKAAGVQFLNISPLKDDVADELQSQWLPIRPNTDTAFLLGIMHTLVKEHLHDKSFLARYCVGFDRFREYLMGESDGVPKSSEWAAEITEIPAVTIRELARRMASTRTMISASWSIQRAHHGEQPYWAIVVLAAMLGQIGLPGGGFGFGYGSNAMAGSPRSSVPVPGLSRFPNPVKVSIPVARVTDMLLNPGAHYDFNGKRLTYPDIRLVYWCGGNPFHKQQDLNQLLKAWQKPDTIVIHEPWWTPAARRADIVLPCVTTLERNDIGASHSDHYWFAMQQAIQPVGEARTEYNIYSALAERLGFKETFTEGRSENDWLRHMYDTVRLQAIQQKFELPNFDQFWEIGHYEFPTPDEPPVLFASFRENPEANPLRTPSGKIEIFSETIHSFGYDDCPGHPMWLEPAEWLGCDLVKKYSLHLISNQPRSRLHSQLDCGAVSAAGKIANREPLWINPQDAEIRGIKHGDIVRIYNDRGACLAGAFVTDQIRSGVIQLATGAWYDPLDRSKIGSMDKHGNPNVLTIDIGTSKLAQSCSAQTNLVQLERFNSQVPDLTAFSPPF